MTGFGEAHCQQDGLAVAIEICAINNRFFKLSVRSTDGYASIEPLVESQVRDSVHRGTIQVNVRIDHQRSVEDYRINVDVLDRYRRQLAALQQQWGLAQPLSFDAMLALPGVVDDVSGEAFDATTDWPIIERTLCAALEGLNRMRAEEGSAMATDLAANCRAAAASLDKIAARAPLVAQEYRARLFERLKRTLGEVDVALEPSDIIKEVSLFADRSDISEEIVRLRSHLDQFQTTMELPESAGRKLDFLTQEMFREANTIGSKANDVEIAQCVIEIKTAIERIREMIQNIE